MTAPTIAGKSPSLEISGIANFINDISTRNAVIENFHKICRFCLRLDNLKPYCDMIYQEDSIKNIIFDCVSLKVDADDHLPYNFCAGCITELIRYYKFKNRCIQINRILQHVYNTSYTKKRNHTAKSNNSECAGTNTDNFTAEEEDMGNVATNHTDNILEDNSDSLTIKDEKIGYGIPIRDDNILDNNTTCNNLIDEKEEITDKPTISSGSVSENIGINDIIIKYDDTKYESSVSDDIISVDSSSDSLSDTENKNDMVDTRKSPDQTDENHELSQSNTVETKSKSPLYFAVYSVCLRSENHQNDGSESTTPPTDEPKPECNICKKSFTLKSSYDRHMLIHTGKRVHKCDTCGKAYIQKCQLTRHMLYHTGEKPYKCSICTRAFTIKHGLNKHMLIHHGKKPLKCSVCKKSFFEKSVLEMHMLIHTCAKPYKCSICETSFFHKYELNKHILIHNN